MEDRVLFRGVKRKASAKRQASAEDIAQSHPKGQALSEDIRLEQAESAEENDSSLSTLLKSRYKGRVRTTGVTFTSATAVVPSSDAEPSSRNLKEPPKTFQSMSDRFVGHTGQNMDADKHMTEYIDSEMAKRRTINLSKTKASKALEHASSPNSPLSESDASDEPDHGTNSASTKFPNKTAPSTRNPAALGQLQEIHLAPTSRRPAQPGSSTTQPESKERRRRLRLTKDGRVIRPRPRRRRPSEDIARDALVEQVLAEHRVDLDRARETAIDNAAAATAGDAPSGKGKAGEGGGEERDNDAALAERFTAEFLEAQSRRRQPKQAMPGASAGAKVGSGAAGAVGSVKGPKLGGSRSARAAMRAMQLAAAAGGTGTGQGKG